jgi:hypothetical protein
MSVELFGDTDPAQVWTGRIDVDRVGAELAIEMLTELQSEEQDEDGVLAADYLRIEDWPRQGRRYRPILIEYLDRARAAGSDAEAGFLAMVGHYLSMVARERLVNLPYFSRLLGLSERSS